MAEIIYVYEEVNTPQEAGEEIISEGTVYGFDIVVIKIKVCKTPEPTCTAPVHEDIVRSNGN